MSTSDSYRYAMAAEASRRVAAEMQRRQITQQNASLAALFYAQSLGSGARHQAHVDSVVNEQMRVLSGMDRRLAASASRIRSIESAAERAERLSGLIRERIEETQAALQQTVARAAALEATLGAEAMSLRASLADARANLTTIQEASNASAVFGGIIVDGVRRGVAEQKAVDATLSRLDQLNRELDFVARDGVYNSAAMATLMAMQENGYELQEVMSEGELASIFAKQDSDKKIAVRLAKVGLAESEEELWRLSAETFDMHGEECLGEIDDFTTALEDELQLGKLQRETRHYPKRDSGKIRDRGTKRGEKVRH